MEKTWSKYLSSETLDLAKNCARKATEERKSSHEPGQANGLTIADGLSLRDLPNKASFCSSHPSPLGASKGSKTVPAFLGSRPFSHTNKLLISMGAEPIDWAA